MTRLAYFEELEKASGRSFDPVSAADIASGRDLSAYDSLVVDDLTAPPTTGVTQAAWVAGLAAFARGGGQLVLTDRAVGLLDDLGVVPTSALTVHRSNAGHVDFGADGALLQPGLTGLPSQTYYEVMLGFPPDVVDSVGPFAPGYSVTSASWTAAGGRTSATLADQGAGSSTDVALGDAPLGTGKVTVFGAVLPQAVETLTAADGGPLVTPHPHGLADYAVTITGGTVLDNILERRRAGSAVAAPTLPEAPLAPLLVLAGLGAVTLVARRRRG